MLPGINISRWQRKIDWPEVKRSGVKFAFIHATEFPEKTTRLSIDTQLENNIQGSIDNGVYWGAIHRFCTHIDPVLQAKVFCRSIGSSSSLPPVIELRNSSIKGERLNYKVRLFAETVEEIIGKKPIIFTDEGFWRGSMCNEKVSHSDWARKYPLWISQFASLWPSAVYPWAAWEFWQHTDRGRIPGIETDVSMIWFNGSEKELKEQFMDEISIESYSAEKISIEKKHYMLIDTQKTAETSELPENFKGDYQEQIQHSYPLNVQRGEMQRGQTKVITENGSNSKEEEWIRDYFFQTA